MRFAIGCPAIALRQPDGSSKTLLPTLATFHLDSKEFPKLEFARLGHTYTSISRVGTSHLILETFLALRRLDRPRYGDGVRSSRGIGERSEGVSFAYR
jgi:hypothetical protein